MHVFRVAISGSFRRPDGRWNFPGLDLGRMDAARNIEVVQLKNSSALSAQDLVDFDGLVLAVDALPAEALPSGGRLMVVSRFGVGYDRVDVAACTNAGVVLSITPLAVRRPVAVAALTLLLAVASKLRTKDSLVRRGPDGFAARADHLGVGLVGRTLASIGLGNIAKEMFRLAEPFGMRHIACDPYVTAAVASTHGIELHGLDTVVQQADFLCLHCPLTDETRHIIDAQRLATMKSSAFLINTARGGLVDQTSLEEALAAGRIAGAGLDVLDPEPTPVTAPILAFENVILSPHALSWTDQGFAAIGADCIAAINAVAQGDLPANIANPEVLKHARFAQRLAARKAASSRSSTSDGLSLR